MTFKATVYDTTNGEPREFIPRWISLNESGKPERISAPSGLQYRDFELSVEFDKKEKADYMDNIGGQ